MEKTNNMAGFKNKIGKDTLIYLFGKGIEGIIGILTLSLYTRFFLPEIYNDYNLITISINIASLILMGWLTQSGVRYINMYSSHNKRKLFISTAFRLWLCINIAVYLICIISYFVLTFDGSNPSGNLKYYILAAALMFTGFSTTQVLSGFLTALRYIKLNLVLPTFSIAAKLTLSIIGVTATPLGSSTPAAVIISSIITDIIVIVIIVTKLKLHKMIYLKAFSKITFRKQLKYGIPIAGMGFAMSLLNLSDRYIINFSLGSVIGPVKNGIYAANYSLASAVFTILMIGMMRGVYPNMLKAWKQNDRETALSMLTQGIRNYAIIGIPCVFGLSILSELISGLFLTVEYHSGSSVIIWVSIGMFFLGLTEYSNKPWELTYRTTNPFINALICGVLNISINIIFIPLYGYKIAAASTALSYILYFLISAIGGRKLIYYRMPLGTILRVLLSCIIMSLEIVFLNHFFEIWQLNKTLSLSVYVVSGAVTYALVLYLTGEIKDEVKIFWKKIRSNPMQ